MAGNGITMAFAGTASSALVTDAPAAVFTPSNATTGRPVYTPTTIGSDSIMPSTQMSAAMCTTKNLRFHVSTNPPFVIN